MTVKTMWLLWREGEGCMWILGPLALRTKTVIFNLTSWAQPPLPLVRGFSDSLTFVYAINIHHSPHLLTFPSTRGLKLEKAWPVNIFSICILPVAWCLVQRITQPVLNEWLLWMGILFSSRQLCKAGVSRWSCSYWENAKRRDRKSSVLIFA